MRSWLYCPGNKPGMMKNAGIYAADGIVLDLEDAVEAGEKDEARILVAEALKSFDFGSVQVAVRINGLSSSYWQDDLAAVVSAGVKIIRIPKIEDPEMIREAAGMIGVIEHEAGLEESGIDIQAILETPRGIMNAASIAEASPRLSGLSFGAEDYCASMGIARNGQAFALDFPRSSVVCAASAAGIESWDTVWADYSDLSGLEDDARRARALGFSGKSLIHPGQIETVNRVFSPDPSEIAWARKVADAVEGTGVTGAFGMDGSMVDAPVIARAMRILSNVEDPGA